ncbi:MAG: hypothetical protein HC859_11600 [Bacteroidia bacterium]|nr:hypothetical protein [Bacteroidia bacterium]
MLLLTSTCASVCAQDNPSLPDSIVAKNTERYWTRKRVVPRAGLALQETASVEVGLAYHSIYVHPLSLASAGPYITFEGIIRDDFVIVGPKAGYEFTAGLVGIAADVTWYTDFSEYSLMATPKAGLSLLGFASLMYGYNIPLNDNEFKSISRNRISLVFNLNRDYLNLKEAPRR